MILVDEGPISSTKYGHERIFLFTSISTGGADGLCPHLVARLITVHAICIPNTHYIPYHDQSLNYIAASIEKKIIK